MSNMKEKNEPVVAEVDAEKPIKGKEETIIKYALITLGGILAICVVALVVFLAIPTKAVSIGNEKITQDEFIYYYKQQADIILEYRDYIAPDVDDFTFLMAEYANGISYSQSAAQRALAVVLETYVLNDLANGEDPDFKYDTIELDESINKFKEDFENYATENDLKNDEVASKLYGCTYKTLIKAYTMSWIATKYQEDQISKLEANIAEEQMIEYYDTFKDDLDAVTVRHILVANFDVITGGDYTEEQLVAAKAKSDEAYAKILAGDDFMEVALAYSEDPGVAENEGLYKFRKEETDLTEFANWAFIANIGDVGQIETYIGYHIVKLAERTTYDDLKDTVKYNLAYGELTKVLNEIESSEKYEIAYYNGFYEF
ncbi:MAG: peptidylprolyl isomerase [Clostridiales bacterium]|nr:peptidylprolyl isomerase [Clostridiales bacterium]